MKGQIRLAERQQLLVGKGLSVVQVSAIMYCEIRDSMQAEDDSIDSIKRAWVASGNVRMPEIDFTALFPDLIDTNGLPTPIEEDYEGDLEHGDRLIFSEQPEMSQAEVEAELMALLSGTGMSVKGGDLYGS